MQAAQYPITLIIIARDEAAVIGQCLDSVPFAAEKLVIDSGSTDGTQEIATRHGARVIHQDWLGFGAQRNFAATQAGNDWILMLDADEALTPALVEEMHKRLPALLESRHAGAILRRVSWYLGAPMRWYRPMVGERIARLYHRTRGRWSDSRVHESLRLEGPLAHLQQPLVHYNNTTLVDHQLKLLRYAELKAHDWIDQRRSSQLWLGPFIFVLTFLKEYLLRLAFLDGWRGYVAAQVSASYAVYKRMRHCEMLHHPQSIDAARRQLQRHGLNQ